MTLSLIFPSSLERSFAKPEASGGSTKYIRNNGLEKSFPKMISNDGEADLQPSQPKKRKTDVQMNDSILPNDSRLTETTPIFAATPHDAPSRVTLARNLFILVAERVRNFLRRYPDLSPGEVIQAVADGLSSELTITTALEVEFIRQILIVFICSFSILVDLYFYG